MKKLLGVLEMFYALRGVVVTRLYILVNTYQTVYLTSVHLAAVYLNEVISIEKIGTVSSDNSLNYLVGKKRREKGLARGESRIKEKGFPFLYLFFLSACGLGTCDCTI